MGGVFLAKYFEEQMVRNRTTGQDSITSMCLCADCSGSDEVIRNVPSENDEEQQQEQQNSLVLVKQDQNSPVPIQPQNLIPFLNFNPAFYNTPRMVMPPTIDALWWSKPVDCCFNHPPWYCNKNQMHLNRIAQNGPVLGRHPHDLNCLKRQILNQNYEKWKTFDAELKTLNEKAASAYEAKARDNWHKYFRLRNWHQ